MKSVGEVMAIGRTLQESLHKALRGLEVGVDGFDEKTVDREVIETQLAEPGPERLWYVADAFRAGLSLDDIFRLDRDRSLVPGTDRGSLSQAETIRGKRISSRWTSALRPGALGAGFSDKRLAKLLNTTQTAVREIARKLGVRPAYKRVDTCRRVRDQHRLHVLDLRETCESNRPARRRSWFSAAVRTASARASSSTTAACMPPWPCAKTATRPSWSNCNPETVSTDYDTSDRLYFEPLTLEDVLKSRTSRSRLASSSSTAARRRSNWRVTSKPTGVPIIGTSAGHDRRR